MEGRRCPFPSRGAIHDDDGDILGLGVVGSLYMRLRYRRIKYSRERVV